MGKLCLRCGTVGPPTSHRAVSVLLLAGVFGGLAWAVVGLPPGLQTAVAGAWLGVATLPKVCRCCHAARLVPLESPAAQRLLPPGTGY